MSLQEKLNALKAKAAASRPAEIRAVLEQGVTELRGSGILERMLKAGARAPQFALPDQNEVTVRSADMLTRGPLVISFYRGHW